MQVALLNNRGLQAAFNDLGVSEAAYVQATLPPAPKISLVNFIGNGSLELKRQIAVSLRPLGSRHPRGCEAADRL